MTEVPYVPGWSTPPTGRPAAQPDAVEVEKVLRGIKRELDDLSRLAFARLSMQGAILFFSVVTAAATGFMAYVLFRLLAVLAAAAKALESAGT
jgi:hypothetical protein